MGLADAEASLAIKTAVLACILPVRTGQQQLRIFGKAAKLIYTCKYGRALKALIDLKDRGVGCLTLWRWEEGCPEASTDWRRACAVVAPALSGNPVCSPAFIVRVSTSREMQVSDCATCPGMLACAASPPAHSFGRGGSGLPEASSSAREVSEGSPLLCRDPARLRAWGRASRALASCDVLTSTAPRPTPMLVIDDSAESSGSQPPSSRPSGCSSDTPPEVSVAASFAAKPVCAELGSGVVPVLASAAALSSAREGRGSLKPCSAWPALAVAASLRAVFLPIFAGFLPCGT